MRKSFLPMLAAASALGLASAVADEAKNTTRIYGFDNIRRALRQRKPDYAAGAHTSIATGNRHGGPHLHQREIARRARQGASKVMRSIYA